ncbi:hypothetical protein EUGRSUZ_L03136 [Eucalyptus grandis]|uniref:Uncharacterized protein n=1 Tax=Eucalyptus grandis TaxID=71139 RepID=A0AAD9T8T2_EUCGR|nr:hypothetical protein EUGRSUZ_L03136 [Eucalyptus grandis]
MQTTSIVQQKSNNGIYQCSNRSSSPPRDELPPATCDERRATSFSSGNLRRASPPATCDERLLRPASPPASREFHRLLRRRQRPLSRQPLLLHQWKPIIPQNSNSMEESIWSAMRFWTLSTIRVRYHPTVRIGIKCLIFARKAYRM